jgi:hypothetical protein
LLCGPFALVHIIALLGSPVLIDIALLASAVLVEPPVLASPVLSLRLGPIFAALVACGRSLP